MNDGDAIRTRLRALISDGSQIAGTGLGAAIGLLWPDPTTVIGAAMAGSAIGIVSNDIAGRVLSPRERSRMGAALIFSIQSLESAMASGAKIREDGFFDADSKDAPEVIEGVLRVARDSYEERKLPYIGNLLASIAVDPAITREMAHMLIALSSGLSWNDFQILAVYDRKESFHFPKVEWQVRDWPEWTVAAAIAQLVGNRLLAYPRVSSGRLKLTYANDTISGIELGEAGRLFVQTTQLNSMPIDEIRELATMLENANGETPTWLAAD